LGAGREDIRARGPDDSAAMQERAHTVGRLRGREPQLDVAGELIDATGRGRAGTLVFEGAPGIGKSRLLGELAAMTRRSRLRVARGQAFEGGWAVPFAPLLGALLDGGLLEREALRRLSQDARFWLLEELHATLEAAALEQPLVIILDDLQWADSGTLVALEELSLRLSTVPVLWVLAARPGETGPELSRLFARLEDAGGTRITLPGVPSEAVAAVIRDRFGADPDPVLLAVAATARGNPFWLTELLDGLADERRVSVTGDVAVLDSGRLPARVTQSMRDRLEGVSPEARQVVRVAALLGSRFAVDDLAVALRRTPIELVGALDEARRADLVDEVGDGLGFRHDIVREAVLGTLQPSVRRGMQRELATLLLEAGATPIDVAGYVADSAQPGDMDAVRMLRDAAASVRLTDGSLAADFSRRALELLPSGDPSYPSHVADTVLMLHAAMRYREADELADATLARNLAPEREAELRLSLSAMIVRGSGTRAEHNFRALALDGVSAELRARHRLWLAHNLCSHASLPDAEAAVRDAVVAAGELGGRSAEALAQLGVIMVLCRSARLAEALALAEAEAASVDAIDEPIVASLVRFHHGNLLAAVGRVDEAMAVHRFNVGRAQRERQAYDLHGWVAFGSRLHFSAGRLADAGAEAEASEAMTLSRDAATLPGASALVARAQIAVHRGDASELRAALEIAHRVVRTGSLVMRVHARWTLALAAHASGDPAAAAAWVTGDDELPYAVPLLPTDPAFHVQAARIAVAAGDEEVAAQARSHLEQLEQANPDVGLLAGLAAHARGLLDGDSGEVQSAIELLRGSQRPLALASALEDGGRALGRDGVGQLREALELYTAAGASVDAQRLVQRLRGYGVRRRLNAQPRPTHGWESLTESERRVVQLVSAGATNREVAARLVLSPHTVSTHLRHAFAKLRINSRVELAWMAAARETAVRRS
jgi:DNA-binding CsgD family transcriptional regulator